MHRGTIVSRITTAYFVISYNSTDIFPKICMLITYLRSSMNTVNYDREVLWEFLMLSLSNHLNISIHHSIMTVILNNFNNLKMK